MNLLSTKIKKFLNNFGYDIKQYHPIFETTIKPLEIDAIIDVGANNGDYAQEIRKKFPQAWIYSFEPLTDCYEILNQKMQNDKKFKSYNFALGEKKEETEIQRSSFNPSSSILTMSDLHKKIYPKSKDISHEKIKIERLDDILHTENLPNKILIKIDVQGFEDKVILGGKEIIKKASIVIIETSFTSLYENQPLFFDINKLMDDSGFFYYGDLHRHYNQINGRLLFEDSIFINKNLKELLFS